MDLNNKQVFYPFVKKAICPLGICLSSLYNDEQTQQLVREIVGHRFEALFDQLIGMARNKKKLNVKDMVQRKPVMKNLFIEFGLGLESLDDLIFLAITAGQMNTIPTTLSYYDLKDNMLKTIELKLDDNNNNNRQTTANVNNLSPNFPLLLPPPPPLQCLEQIADLQHDDNCANETAED